MADILLDKPEDQGIHGVKEGLYFCKSVLMFHVAFSNER
jgi:hypothetical protein